MARPASVVARERADMYATRAMVVEILRHISLTNTHITTDLKAAIRRRVLKPIDITVSEQDVRDSFDAILDDVAR